MSESIYRVLKGKVIGISTSDSEDFYKPGTRNYLLSRTRVGIIQHLLSCGCTIAYGGDLRKGGFTEALIDIVEDFFPENEEQTDQQPRLINYLGWPSDIDLTEDQEARLSKKVRFVKAGLPPDIKGSFRPQYYLVPKTPKEFYIRARSLTHMRETMSRDIDACIVLSGRMIGARGKYPGVVEETHLAMQAKKPTYVISAFGGAATDIAETLTGYTGNRISNEYQFMGGGLHENVQYFNSQHTDPIDYRSLSSYFNRQGVAGLHNALCTEENKDLFNSTDVSEIISLVTKGLVKNFSA